MARPVALLDANVVYPARLRDLLIRLAIAGLYQARWSEQILDECFENLIQGPARSSSEEQLARTRRLMTTALPDAMVSGYETLVEEQDLPDPDDRHVLAAALTAGAALLVTANLDDFPAEQMPTGLSVVSPDGLVLELMNDDLDTVVDVVAAQAAALTNPPMTTRQLLDGLEAVGLVRTVAQLRGAVS
jgi:predicted nucleic acid-binding protein